MSERLRWGILATGVIAREFADGVIGSTTGSLQAVGSRETAKAQEFAARYHVPRAYGSYEDLLADSEVQAVYISTPHPMHAEWAIKTAEAGKHVLVEKPIGMNEAEAMAITGAARLHDVFLMEAFMYRCHPQIAELVRLIRSGVVGQVQLIQAAFSYRSGAAPGHRTFAQALGGGGILDVGCYPVSMSRLLAGAATGKPFDEPIEFKGCGHLGDTGVDEWAIASLRFPGDVLAQLSTGVRLNQHQENVVHVVGTEGKLTVPDPWTPSRWNRDPAILWIKRHDEKEPRRIVVDAPLDLYTYEADTVARHIPERQSPTMNWDDSLGNMRALDRWRREVGLVYEFEKPENATRFKALNLEQPQKLR